MKKFCIFLACLTTMIGFADVPVVENGLSPSDGAVTFKLTEDLRVGPENGGDQFLWVGLSVGIDVNKAGHMFVADFNAKRIIELDPKGNFVRQIGGPGEGPGEFQQLQFFKIHKDGSATGFGTQGPTSTLHYFDNNMKFIDRHVVRAMDGLVQTVGGMSPDGKRMVGSLANFDQDRAKMIITFAVMDEKAVKVQEFGVMETMIFNPQRATEPAFWSEFISEQLKQYSKGIATVMQFDGKGNLYTAKGHTYEITRWTPDYKKDLVIKRKVRPQPQSEEEIMAVVDPIKETLTNMLPPALQRIAASDAVITKAVEMAEFPSYKLPVNNILTMEDGKLLVINAGSLVTGESTVDIFSTDGKYLGSYTHGGGALPRMVFQNGYGYTIETDENDDNYAVRYKVELVPVK